MSWWSAIGNLFSSGDGDSGGGNGWGNIFQAILGGVSGSAEAKLGVEAVKKKAETEGLESRKNSLFEYQLLDLAKQQDKYRKRAALDTYGQFNQIKKWAPNYVPNNPAIQVPAIPDPTK